MDDIICRLKKISKLFNLQISKSQLKNHVLFELEKLFNKNYCPFSNYNLLMPNKIMVEEINNRLLREELDYDVQKLEHEHLKLFKYPNEEQKVIYDVVLNAVTENKDGLFFVYGHGGIGKTYFGRQ